MSMVHLPQEDSPFVLSPMKIECFWQPLSVNSLTSMSRSVRRVRKFSPSPMFRPILFLPPANEVWGEILFSQASVCPQGTNRSVITLSWNSNSLTSIHSSRMRIARLLTVCLLWGGLPSGMVCLNTGGAYICTDRHLWKHYFPATSFAGDNKN